METHHEGVDVSDAFYVNGVEVLSGSALSINGVEVLSNVANLHAIKKIVKVPLVPATGNTAGSLLAWANPEGVPIMVTRFILDITTPATGAATADFGVAADGATSSDTLVDGVDIGSAAIVADNIDGGGTNGKSFAKMTASQYITGSQSASSVGLVGNAYIEYFIP